MIFRYIISIKWHFIWNQRDIKIIQMNEISSEHRKMDQRTGNWPETGLNRVRIGSETDQSGTEIPEKEFESKIKSFFTPKVVSAIFFLTRNEFIFIHKVESRNNNGDSLTDVTRIILCQQNSLLSPFSSRVRIKVLDVKSIWIVVQLPCSSKLLFSPSIRYFYRCMYMNNLVHLKSFYKPNISKWANSSTVELQPILNDLFRKCLRQ